MRWLEANIQNQNNALKIEIKEKIIGQLVEHFKPMEAKLKGNNSLRILRVADRTMTILTEGALTGARTPLPLSCVIPQHQYYMRRSEPNWYNSIETQIVKYLNGESNDTDIRKLIDNEQLEKDQNYFQEYVKSFLEKYTFSLFDDYISDDIRIRHFHVEGICLIYDLTWYFIKASIFEIKQLWDKVKEINRKIESITTTLDTNEYYPLVTINISNDKNQQQQQMANDKINFKIIGKGKDNTDLYRRLETLFNVTILNDQDEFSVERSSFISIIKFLTRTADLQVKSVLIRNFKIAIGTKVLNPSFNRIYGESDVSFKDDEKSFMKTNFGHLTYSGRCYYCPNGWRRYSLMVAESSEEFDRKYSEWPVAYHGTASYNLMNILKTGFYEAEVAVFGNGWYFSPSIEYCGHPRYAKVIKLDNYYVQTVLQCRINPIVFDRKQVIEKQGTLLGAFENDPPLDPNYKDNKSIEWVLLKENIDNLIKDHNLIVIYGLMLRITKDHPSKLKCNKWWQKYACCNNYVHDINCINW